MNKKQPRKPPKDGTLLEWKHKNFAREDHVVEQKQDDHDKSMLNLGIECGIEELEVAKDKRTGLFPRKWIYEMEKTERTLEAKRFSMNRLAQDPKVFKFHTGFAGEHCYCLLDFLGNGMNSRVR